MFCPKCGAEYRHGFSTCADCGVPLVEHLPASAEKPREEARYRLDRPMRDAVKVFEKDTRKNADIHNEAWLLNALEDLGIPYYIEKTDYASYLTRMHTEWHAVEVYVSVTHKAQVADIIRQYDDPQAAPPDETPASGALPQKVCPECGQACDIDYPKCPRCGRRFEEV